MSSNERIRECEFKVLAFEMFSEKILVSQRPLEVAAVGAQNSDHVPVAVVSVEALSLCESDSTQCAEVLTW